MKEILKCHKDTLIDGSSVVVGSLQKTGWVLGIDATNLSAGGGRIHLIELLFHAKPELYGFSKVVVWGSISTLALLPNTEWLVKRNSKNFEKGFIRRSLWQMFQLERYAKAEKCDLLFVPGGSHGSSFRPVVTMSQNMLPFEWKEIRRYVFSIKVLKLLLLRLTQSRSFKASEGVIFLSKYAKIHIEKITGCLSKTALIPHGVSNRFISEIKNQISLSECTSERPFRIIYVSPVLMHKHQWFVVEAVAYLRKLYNWNLSLTLVGPSLPEPMLRLNASLIKHDPYNQWVSYQGEINYSQLHEVYQKADLAVYASSCENMPITLLEHMAAGLAIACSNRGPMPEILGPNGYYFNPEDPYDIAASLKILIEDPVLRTKLSRDSFLAAQQYSWPRCADNTFKFLKDILINRN